jgi:hypothetical protein
MPMLLEKTFKITHNQPDCTTNPNVGQLVSSNQQTQIIFGKACCPRRVGYRYREPWGCLVDFRDIHATIEQLARF